MTVLMSEIRSGVYLDSVILMQVQGALLEEDGIEACGAVMAAEANLAILAASGLLPPELRARDLAPEDLLVVVRAAHEAAAKAALGKLDQLLRRRAEAGEAFRPRSLRTASAGVRRGAWVLISVPGRHAAEVAEEALGRGFHVFLYSDNVSLEDEARLKGIAAEKGLMVMGPDCGTAAIAGVGFGFANAVRRGPVGLVGASGTGLQTIASHLDARGIGVSHILGLGGRDLSAEVGGATARQALDLLARDPGTEVLVLVSKPPAAEVARRLGRQALALGKPVILSFPGQAPPARRLGPLAFAAGLRDAAELAAGLLSEPPQSTGPVEPPVGEFVRGIFSGGTLAFEVLRGLAAFLRPIYSNLALTGVQPLADPTHSRAHTVVDLGADELTVGRLHPMLDLELCRGRLLQEAADPRVGAIVLDLVLGHGAHPDPAAVLAPAIHEARQDRQLPIWVIVIGAEGDPQDLEEQIERVEAAGARVVRDPASVVEPVCRQLSPPAEQHVPVPVEALAAPVEAINIGLETFHQSLEAQGATAVHVEWRPPAGGDARLASILRRLRPTGDRP